MYTGEFHELIRSETVETGDPNTMGLIIENGTVEVAQDVYDVLMHQMGIDTIEDLMSNLFMDATGISDMMQWSLSIDEAERIRTAICEKLRGLIDPYWLRPPQQHFEHGDGSGPNPYARP